MFGLCFVILNDHLVLPRHLHHFIVLHRVGVDLEINTASIVGHRLVRRSRYLPGE
jgi:hypothetical protein